MGENEIRNLERELLEEKEKEERLERKVRDFRRFKCKARLGPGKESVPAKRQKLDDSSYVSIRQAWGAPDKTVPQKTEAEIELLEIP